MDAALSHFSRQERRVEKLHAEIDRQTGPRTAAALQAASAAGRVPDPAAVEQAVAAQITAEQAALRRERKAGVWVASGLMGLGVGLVSSVFLGPPLGVAIGAKVAAITRCCVDDD